MKKKEIEDLIGESMEDMGLDEHFEECEGCGQEPGQIPGCPLCCGTYYSPGSEDCDWCEHSDECGKC